MRHPDTIDYCVVDRRGSAISPAMRLVPALRMQRADIDGTPFGYGVRRISDGEWLSRRLGSAPDIESAARLTWREVMEMPVEIEEEAMEDA